MARFSFFLLVTLILQGLCYDQSLASVQLVENESKFALSGLFNRENILNGNEDSADEELTDRQIIKDAYGVERSVQPFKRPPQLFLDITAELKAKPGKTPVQLAEDLLRNGDFKGSQGPLIKAAWDTAITRKTNVGIFRPLADPYKKDPVKVAAHVYTMDEPFNGKKVYAEFNDLTSKHQSSGASYQSFPFKGLYGLLMLGMKKETMETYRGVSFPVDAEKNKYIRFNRFLSTSVRKAVAQGFAGASGTVFIIKGSKTASYITPYSQIAGEEEYLISPDAQFLVLDVNKSKTPWVITMQTVDYS